MASKHQKNLTARGQTAPRPGRNTKKIVILSVIAVLVAAAILSVALILILDWDEYHYIPADRKTVATCNGYKIPYEELRFVTMLAKSEMAYEYGEDIWKDPATAESYRAELEARVRETLTYHYALITTSESVNQKPSRWDQKQYVDEQIQAIKLELLEQKMDYDTYLSECYMTRHYHRTYLGMEYLERVFLPGKLVELDGYEYSHDNINDYVDYVMTGEDYVSVVQIRTENVETAQTISDALQAETDFDARYELFCEYIGGKYNKDTTLFGSNGLYYTRGQRSKTYEDAAFALADGEVSDPVVAEDGIWVIMRLPLKETYVKMNAHTLLNHYYNAIINRACTVEFNDYGSSIDLVAMQ